MSLEQEFSAQAFESLLKHLRNHPEVQNIDLMNLAGFCRNCLAEWYREAATAQGRSLSKEQARELVYGMPFEEWKARYQKPANATQLTQLEKSKPNHS